MSGVRHADRPGNGATLDELLAALADRQRREIIRYFREGARETATIEEIASAIVDDPSSAERERTALALHHAALPKLEEVGVVDYDSRTRTARYRGDEIREPVRGLLDDVRTLTTG